jgi:hypothetical protein
MWVKVAILYANKTTSQVTLDADGEGISLNGRYLEDALKSALQLGWEKINLNYEAPNRAIQITSGSNKSAFDPKATILLMPVMAMDGTDWKKQPYGSIDLDFDRMLVTTYSLSQDNGLENGQSIDLGMPLSSKQAKEQSSGSLSSAQEKVVTVLMPKNSTIPVLDFAAVDDGTLRIADLENFLVIDGSGLPNGFYENQKGALVPSSYSDDPTDVPKVPQDELQNVLAEVTLSIQEFQPILSMAAAQLGKDDLRPMLSGVCFDFTKTGLLLAGTDAYSLASKKLLHGEFPKVESVVKPKWLKYLTDNSEGEISVRVFERYTEFKTNIGTLYCRNIDGKYPNYQNVIPEEAEKSFSFDTKAFKKALSTLNHAYREMLKSEDMVDGKPTVKFDRVLNGYALRFGWFWKENDHQLFKEITSIEAELGKGADIGKNVRMAVPQGIEDCIIAFPPAQLNRILSDEQTTKVLFTANNRAGVILWEGQAKEKPKATAKKEEPNPSRARKIKLTKAKLLLIKL